jgi:hypothetical protein
MSGSSASDEADGPLAGVGASFFPHAPRAMLAASVAAISQLGFMITFSSCAT